jgi:hypothetical protein
MGLAPIESVQQQRNTIHNCFSSIFVLLRHNEVLYLNWILTFQAIQSIKLSHCFAISISHIYSNRHKHFFIIEIVYFFLHKYFRMGVLFCTREQRFAGIWYTREAAGTV